MNSKGTTFVEVMIACVIFGIIMLYGFGFYTYGQKNIRAQRANDYALKLCEDAIEYLKSRQDYNIIPSSYTVKETFPFLNLRFEREYGSVEIETLDEKYKIVCVTTTYKDENGNVKTISLKTIISPYAPY